MKITIVQRTNILAMNSRPRISGILTQLKHLLHPGKNEMVILICILHKMSKRKREMQRKANVLPLPHLQRRFGKLFQN